MMKNIKDQLFSNDIDVRIKAISQLSKFDDAAAISLLTPLLKDENYIIRSEVVNNLSKHNDPGTYQDLVSTLLLDDPDGHISVDIGSIGEPIVDNLIMHLDHPDKWVRARIVAALGFTRHSSAVQHLLNSMAYDEDQEDVSPIALLALTRFDKEPITPFIDAYNNSEWEIREGVVLALGWFRSEEAIDMLIEAIKDPNSLVRRKAIYGLGQSKSEKAILYLEEIIQTSENSDSLDNRIIQEAKYALSEIKRNQGM